MGKDLIIGVVDNYDWDKIQYWANSIDQSGFTGYKAVFVYNMDVETVEKLTEKKFMVVGSTPMDSDKGFVYDSKGGSIMVNRFVHLYQFLYNLGVEHDIRYVIATDVRDVVFQSNPTEWLNKLNIEGGHLIVGSENLCFKDEVWNINNMYQVFGQFFAEKMATVEIYCAGVLAGTLDSFRDMCLNLWLICHGLNPHVPGGGGPDQAALNLMLSMDSFKKQSVYLSPLTAWVCHAGTTIPAVKAGSGAIGELYLKDPNLDIESKYVQKVNYELKDDVVYVSGEDEYNKVCIVHQWDRVPDWKIAFEKKYGGK